MESTYQLSVQGNRQQSLGLEDAQALFAIIADGEENKDDRAFAVVVVAVDVLIVAVAGEEMEADQTIFSRCVREDKEKETYPNICFYFC